MYNVHRIKEKIQYNVKNDDVRLYTSEKMLQ